MSGSALSIVLILSTLVDAAVAAVVLFLLSSHGPSRNENPRISASTLAGTLFALGAVFLLKLPLLALMGVNFFGIIHLAYLHMALTLPALGVLVLAAGLRPRGKRLSRRLTGGAIVLALASLPGVPIALYATCLEPFRLQTETAVIHLSASRIGVEPLRIGVLSDIQTAHVTDYERSAVDRLMELAPDVILIPGDLYQGENLERELPKLRDLLGRLSAPGGIYLVQGNTDSPGELARILDGTGVRFLSDELVRVQVGDRKLTVGGVGYPSSRGIIQELETDPSVDDIRILLAHYPDVLLRISRNSRIDLVVAGHTHGGQVQIPLLGPLITLSRVPRRVAAGGYHNLEGRRIYVSRGIGCERGQAPRIRFLCPPEISLLTLTGP